MSLRPQNKTLRNVIDYLESIGLSVYGHNIDLETGELKHALMDFNAEEVVRYRKLYEADGIFEPMEEI